MAVLDRVKQVWNAFRQSDSQSPAVQDFIVGAPSYSSISPSQPRRRYSGEKTIISAIYARLSIDVAGVYFRHIKVDEEDRYDGEMDSPLNLCFKLEPNLDQGPRAWRQDNALTLFDNGVSALVPVDTTLDPNSDHPVDIFTLRVGQIMKWYPEHVRVSVYNEKTGRRQEILLEKRSTGIVENPLYTVMNGPNSTLQRLIRKLTILDAIDEQSGSGKLDIIIQLPYVVKSEARKNQAEQRRTDIELQLKDSQYGIAYADATEKITQLNRPAENNLMAQIEFLVKMLYNQLGLTEEVMNGTADEAAMINYFNRTIDPIVEATVEAMQRAFIGHQGMTNLERIKAFRDPFKLVPVSQLAEIADKLTRNEIVSANEFRGFIGLRPSKEPNADKLANSNMPADKRGPADPTSATPV